MTETRMLRVPAAAHATLARMAAEEQVSLAEMTSRLIEDAWWQRVMDDTNRHYAELRADTQAWTEEQAERALWDTTLMDGLKRDPYPLAEPQ